MHHTVQREPARLSQMPLAKCSLSGHGTGWKILFYTIQNNSEQGWAWSQCAPISQWSQRSVGSDRLRTEVGLVQQAAANTVMVIWHFSLLLILAFLVLAQEAKCVWWACLGKLFLLSSSLTVTFSAKPAKLHLPKQASLGQRILKKGTARGRILYLHLILLHLV